MKKKGLIISTVVMAVVLIAALTTSTYAWFTAQSRASVDKIQFAVSSSSDVLIGAKITNAYEATVTNDSFVSGNTQFDATATDKWSGDQGLGGRVNPDLNMSGITQAVWTGTDTTFDAADKFGTNSSFLKASGSGTTITTGTIYPAVANTDYLDITFGVKANKDNLTGIALVVVIKDTGTLTTLGMNAALQYTAKIDNGTATSNTEFYSTAHYNTVKTSMTKPTVTFNGKSDFKLYSGETSLTLGQGDSVAIIEIDKATGDATLDINKIYQVQLRIFLAGYDTDCINAAANASADICLNFVATTKA